VTRAALARVVLLVAVLGAPALASAWNDATGELDMPWLGSGERARLFSETTSCVMCPTGSSDHRSWGSSGRGGSDPYDDVQAALRFLKKKGILDAWPEAIAEGSVGDGSEIIEPRATPYRFTIVMLDPLVVVMRFDLGALVKIGGADPDQAIGTPRLNQGVEFGTRVPATGHLRWFSPAADQAPTPVTMLAPDRGEIVASGVRLELQRHGDVWTVGAPQRGAHVPRPAGTAGARRGWFW
jgi:hypothetical protein